MHSFVPVAVAALAPFAAASAVLPEFLDFSVLISRQAPGTPAYECHSDCGKLTGPLLLRAKSLIDYLSSKIMNTDIAI